MRALVTLAVVVASLALGACGDDGMQDNARHVVTSDAQLACLALWDHDRLCLGTEAAGDRDASCPQESENPPSDSPWALYDTYGAECVRAATASWNCQADLECGATEGCEAEIVARASSCSLSAGDAG